MTTASLSLEAVSYVLPDGRQLFSGLNAHFDRVPTALVGGNGVGKSVLARILVGQIAPSTGCCGRTGRIHYLPQQISCAADANVAALAGVADILDALTRIEAGSCDELDFELVGERWDIAAQLAIELQRQGLSAVTAQTPLACLSGGEQMRVALAGAWLAQPDFLVLDEPSNHLDWAQRLGLLERLEQWTGGLLVISHDRELLETLQRTLELTPAGLHEYGGNYTFYAQARAQQRQSAFARLQHSKLQRERGEQAICEQRERQQRRQARGNRAAQQANQAKILLGRQKDHSQASAGRLRQRHLLAQQRLQAQVHAAMDQAVPEQTIALLAVPATPLRQHWPLLLKKLLLPFGAAGGQALDLAVAAGERIALTGANGAGKSTLLRVLAGSLPPAGGSFRAHGTMALLDQALQCLDPTQNVLKQLQAATPVLSTAQLRSRLALLGLDAARITLPCALLSGGERLKAALACVLYAEPAVQVLLLDEPSNHLDLAVLQTLENMLGNYPGTLLVSSHDEVFLQQLRPHWRLNIDASGWSKQTW